MKQGNFADEFLKVAAQIRSVNYCFQVEELVASSIHQFSCHENIVSKNFPRFCYGFKSVNYEAGNLTARVV